MVLDKGLDGVGSDGRSSGPTGGQSQLVTVGDGSWSVLKPWQKLKPLIEILCNNQASGYILVTIWICAWLRVLHIYFIAMAYFLSDLSIILLLLFHILPKWLEYQIGACNLAFHFVHWLLPELGQLRQRWLFNGLSWNREKHRFRSYAMIRQVDVFFSSTWICSCESAPYVLYCCPILPNRLKYLSFYCLHII